MGITHSLIAFGIVLLVVSLYIGWAYRREIKNGIETTEAFLHFVDERDE